MLDLKGSEKQIAWANELREVFHYHLDQAINSMDREIIEWESYGESEIAETDHRKNLHAQLIVIGKEVDEIEKAEFWINLNSPRSKAVAALFTVKSLTKKIADAKKLAGI